MTETTTDRTPGQLAADKAWSKRRQNDLDAAVACVGLSR